MTLAVSLEPLSFGCKLSSVLQWLQFAVAYLACMQTAQRCGAHTCLYEYVPMLLLLQINAEVLTSYAACANGAEVVQAQAAYMEQCAQEAHDRRAAGSIRDMPPSSSSESSDCETDSHSHTHKHEDGVNLDANMQRAAAASSSSSSGGVELGCGLPESMLPPSYSDDDQYGESEDESDSAAKEEAAYQNSI
jgi:hypothetical protein